MQFFVVLLGALVNLYIALVYLCLLLSCHLLLMNVT